MPIDPHEERNSRAAAALALASDPDCEEKCRQGINRLIAVASEEDAELRAKGAKNALSPLWFVIAEKLFIDFATKAQSFIDSMLRRFMALVPNTTLREVARRILCGESVAVMFA